MDDVVAVLMNAVRHLLHREVARSGEEDGELHEHLAAVTAAAPAEMPAAVTTAADPAEPYVPATVTDTEQAEPLPAAESEHAEDHA